MFVLTISLKTRRGAAAGSTTEGGGAEPSEGSAPCWGEWTEVFGGLQVITGNFMKYI